MIKKDVLKNIGFFNPCLLQTQDFELWIRILIGGFDVGLIEEKLTYYRINDNNLSYANKKIDHKFLSRIYFENQKILESFLKIKNTNEICQIFPEIREKYPEMKDQYIPYYIAIEALEFSHKENFKNSVVYRNFAINVFYDLLQNEEKRKYLEDNFQFKTGDFIKLISDNPLIIDLCKNTKNLKALNKLSLPQRLRKSFSKKSQKIKTLFKK
jgi:hypothetical protein